MSCRCKENLSGLTWKRWFGARDTGRELIHQWTEWSARASTAREQALKRCDLRAQLPAHCFRHERTTQQPSCVWETFPSCWFSLFMGGFFCLKPKSSINTWFGRESSAIYGFNKQLRRHSFSHTSIHYIWNSMHPRISHVIHQNVLVRHFILWFTHFTYVLFDFACGFRPMNHNFSHGTFSRHHMSSLGQFQVIMKCESKHGGKNAMKVTSREPNTVEKMGWIALISSSNWPLGFPTIFYLITFSISRRRRVYLSHIHYSKMLFFTYPSLGSRWYSSPGAERV